MENKKVANVRLVDAAAARPVLEVEVPRGATLKDSIRVVESLDGIIQKLTGCPCISGLDVRFRDMVLQQKVEKFSQEIALHG
jgi:hypothetical protein